MRFEPCLADLEHPESIADSGEHAGDLNVTEASPALRWLRSFPRS